jgi:hypothetical protein
VAPAGDAAAAVAQALAALVASMPQPLDADAVRRIAAEEAAKVEAGGITVHVPGVPAPRKLDGLAHRLLPDVVETVALTGKASCRLLATGEATPLARRAYDAIRHRVEAAVEQHVGAVAVSARRVRRYGEEGDEIDTARVAAGDPDCWSRRVRLARRRTFRLAINVQTNCSETDRTFAATAALACAAASALSRRGYGVEILPVMYSREHDTMRLGVFQPAKHAHDPLDTERILSWGQPAALRLLGFALQDAAEEVEPRCSWSRDRGEPRPLDAEALRAVGAEYGFSTTRGEDGELETQAEALAVALFRGVEGVPT